MSGTVVQDLARAESPLLQKLAAEYRRAGMTDQQVLADLKRAVQFVPELAAEPGFEKAAGAWDLGVRVINGVKAAPGTIKGFLASGLGGQADDITAGLGRAAVPHSAPIPAPRVAPTPPVFRPAPRVAPTPPVTAANATSPAVAAIKAAPSRFVNAASPVVNAAKSAPGQALGAVRKYGPAAVGYGALGAGTSATAAGLVGGDPLMSGVGGFATGMTLGPFAGPAATAATTALAPFAGAEHLGASLTDTAQRGLRSYVDPVLGTNLGSPRQYTAQDPSRAASVDQLDAAIALGGNDFANAPQPRTPVDATRLYGQMRTFRDQAQAAAKALPADQTATPDAVAARLNQAIPGINDAVLSDPTIRAAATTPAGQKQLLAETARMEQQLLQGVGQNGTFDPKTHGPQLATVAKRRLAVTAAAQGMQPRDLAARAAAIERNLTDGNLTPDDLQAALTTPAGREFVETLRATQANQAGLASIGQPSTYAPTAPTAPAAPVPPDTAPPAAGSWFQQIGKFAAENPAQFAALSLGIPIAISGLAMSLTNGPSIGGLLALLVGGGAIAGGMGQFGGVDLAGPAQQFFQSLTGPDTEPPAPPAAEGGAAVQPAAPPSAAPNAPAMAMAMPDVTEQLGRIDAAVSSHSGTPLSQFLSPAQATTLLRRYQTDPGGAEAAFRAHVAAARTAGKANWSDWFTGQVWNGIVSELQKQQAQ